MSDSNTAYSKIEVTEYSTPTIDLECQIDGESLVLTHHTWLNANNEPITVLVSIKDYEQIININNENK
jgi:hypothetical protein